MRTNLLIVGLALIATACAPKTSNQTAMNADDSAAGIIGGVVVAAKDPVASATVALASEDAGVFCSAVLIAKNLVVTAGHCTGVTQDPRDMIIIFGLNPYAANAVKRKVLGGKVTAAWPKLSEETEKDWGDVAVLRFEGEAPAGAVPAKLLASSASLKKDMDVTLAGFGLTEIVPRQVTPKKLMKASVKLSNPAFSKTEIQFQQYNGKGACHGDSGGPAYATINGTLVLIGVTSRSATQMGGYTCAEGSVYTSVAGQAAFLKSASTYLNSAKFVPGQPIPQPQGM